MCQSHPHPRGGGPRYSPPSTPSSPEITAPLPPLPPPPTALKITGGDFQTASGRPASRPVSQALCDRLDPEDSIRDIISENDFYRFVLFKRHYQKYLDISQKYEEARNIAYYLEEKYHEIKAERDRLAKSQKELQKRLETRDQEMIDKEEELFLQLEKAVRLEEDCEKVSFNKIYKYVVYFLKLQADESEVTRRRLERARHDVVRQVTAIVAEKDSLERENERLREALKDVEQRGYRHSYRRYNMNVQGLEKEVSNLKLVAKQSATLNSQLKKGMKHLAMCRRRKCSVCAYTRATFGEYASSSGNRGKLFSCFQAPFGEMRKRGGSRVGGGATFYDTEESLSDRLSQLSLPTAGGSPSSRPSSHYLPSPLLPLQHISYIDEVTSSSDEEEEEEEEEECRYAPTDASTTSSAPHAFSSDSGFSSELCESAAAATPGGHNRSLQRATKWTSSFRKLIRRVSKKTPNSSASSSSLPNAT
ncbi:uncharacterized protein LOC111057612 [Nilaparvata lugens]|uniref:uncharacterized protein LOC111057612 n=1 Tax=Nilaparvata lugens TaxID=108931 RepID=UPI00193DB6BE|nr:uncharacterized protein LOC111057612 [Nilaparvata lugens]